MTMYNGEGLAINAFQIESGAGWRLILLSKRTLLLR